MGSLDSFVQLHVNLQLSQTVKVLKIKYKLCKKFSFLSFPVSLSVSELVLTPR